MEESRSSGSFFHVLLVDLLPFAGLGLISTGLPEFADGAGELGCHGVVSVTAAHQILSQPALILFPRPITLSKVPRGECSWRQGRAGAIRTGHMLCCARQVLVAGTGGYLTGKRGQRGADVKKRSLSYHKITSRWGWMTNQAVQQSGRLCHGGEG